MSGPRVMLKGDSRTMLGFFRMRQCSCAADGTHTAGHAWLGRCFHAQLNPSTCTCLCPGKPGWGHGSPKTHHLGAA